MKTYTLILSVLIIVIAQCTFLVLYISSSNDRLLMNIEDLMSGYELQITE